jgi:hypothetical protein
MGVESGHSCLIPDFRGNGFSFSSLSIKLAICLSYIIFIILSYSPSIAKFLQTFILKWCWILSKAFSASIEMIEWFLSLLLLVCCTIDLQILNHPCILGMKPTWLLWMIFLICCWIQFAIILLRIFASLLIKKIGL